MCGIAGFHSLHGQQIDKAGRLADNLLLAIESRGRDATGLLALSTDGKTVLDKLPLPASSFINGRDRFASPRSVILHTRWATVGARSAKRNAHPQVAGRIAAVHNGTISNHAELFKAFGLSRKAQVDSEIIPALIAHAGWEQAESALSLMRGGAATAVVNFDQPDEMLLARIRSYPLAWGVARGLVVFASTPWAIRAAWDVTYKESFPGKITELGIGEALRLNGEVKRTEIPGVFGVEKEWSAFRAPASSYQRPKQRAKGKSTATPGVAVGKSQKRRSRAKAKGQQALPLASMTEAERQARLAAMRSGTTHTHQDVIALIDLLEEERAKRADAEGQLADLYVAEELEWDDDRAMYAPAKWWS